jgi:hypothetical protein
MNVALIDYVSCRQKSKLTVNYVLIFKSIRVQVELTSNHQGHFEFRLCPTDNSSSEVTQECLDRLVLDR